MQSIKKIKASNLLSFGPDGLDLELGSLNVLIGANGSGKSNFLEIFSLLRSLPRSSEESSTNLQGVIRRGGGMREWVWKGNLNQFFDVEVIVQSIDSEKFLRHFIGFENGNNLMQVSKEGVSAIANLDNEGLDAVYVNASDGSEYLFTSDEQALLIKQPKDSRLSIFSRLGRIGNFLELETISNFYEKIRLYREWTFGRKTVFRSPQSTDQRNDRLEEDFSNLGLFLNRLAKYPQVKKQLVEELQNLYQNLEGYEVIIEGNTVQVFFNEKDFLIPATRLSDGSLRYLCLLAILLDPTPPPLICIEEPELGMHPDLIPKIADLLKNAAERTQLIITTHSDILIDAMTDRPEDVLVCEKEDGQTRIKRLDKADLTHWLEQYRLGQLWSMGEIGGNRW